MCVQSDGSLSTFQDLGLTGGVMSPAEGGGAAAPSYIDVVVPRSYCMLTRSVRTMTTTIRQQQQQHGQTDSSPACIGPGGMRTTTVCLFGHLPVLTADWTAW